MKKLLLTTLTMVLFGSLQAFNRNEIEALADKAYKVFVTAFIQQDANALFSFNVVKHSVELESVKNSLHNALNEDDKQLSNQLAQPAIIFGKRLKAKLADAQQIIIDFDIQDQKMADWFAAGAINDYTYGDALRRLDMFPLFLYTLEELNETEQAIKEIVEKMVHSFFICFTSINQAEAELRNAQLNICFDEVKKMPLIEQLKKEYAQAQSLAKKSVGTLVEAEKTAKNFRFFKQLCDVMFTDKVTIFRKYTITDPDLISYCNWIMDNRDPERLMNSLGFSR